MKENEAIEIRVVSNGFIVTPSVRPNECISESETKVFRSMNELCRFIQDNFTYRGQSLESDS